VGWHAQLLAHGSKAATVVLTSAAIIVGLLNGACGGGGFYVEPPGHCWRPGVCREVSNRALCSSGETFEDGDCATMLRVGDCVRPDGSTVHLYAPLHGILTPDCESLAGAGAHYQTN
jgi:hypothetical protein